MSRLPGARPLSRLTVHRPENLRRLYELRHAINILEQRGRADSEIKPLRRELLQLQTQYADEAKKADERRRAGFGR